jgi:hypothetical protein
MPADIKDIISNIKEVYMSDSNLETLLSYERVLDELDLYTFSNWKQGELVEGPIYEKYFVTCKWMYDYRKMPDPAGAERLLSYGCEITYQEDMLSYPIKITGPDDYKPGTRTNKLVEKPVWIVTITMPKTLMDDIQQGSVELESETLEAQDIEMSQEEGLDDLENSDTDQETAGNV